MNKTQLIFAWAMGILMVLELLVLLLLVYFASLPFFFTFFIAALKLLSPLFLCAYAIFLILVLFIRERRLIVGTWKANLLENLRFLAISFIIALVMMIVSAVMGALIVFLLKFIYLSPKTQGILGPLKKWVGLMFY